MYLKNPSLGDIVEKKREEEKREKVLFITAT